CAHINLMPVAALIARARRIPLVLAIYGIDAWQRPASRLATASLRAADLVISISQITLDRFRAWSGGPGAAAVVPNAIRPQCYGPGPKAADLVERHGLAGRKVIMTLGRMSPTERYKGFDEVIGVLPRLRAAEPGIVYLAAGDGDDRPRLEAEARQAGVADIVIFPGRIPDARKADYYRLADAYVMPSSGEGFGFVVLEALACGVPVVASAADGTREAVLDGTLGAVVDPGDPAALQTAIQTALRQPKRVPRGLEFFSFEIFAARLGLALTRVVDI